MYERFLSDLGRYSPEEVISRWNLRRICYVCGLIILLEFINLLDAGVRTTPYLWITSLVIIIAGIPILCLCIWVVNHFQQISNTSKHRLYVMFWTILPTIVAFSFFYRDASADRPPLNLLIIIGLISMVPILNTKETIMVFICPMLANVGLYLWLQRHDSYLLYCVIFCIAGILITAVVHHQYIYLIKELNRLRTHDPLTNLMNRQAGSERAQLLISTCQREQLKFAALMIDIDYFKSFNDTKGHLYGDEVLVKLSQCLQETFSRNTDVVYRYGGEEFCICLISDDHLQDHLDVLMSNIKQLNIKACNTSVSDLLTISVGVAIVTPQNTSMDTVLKVADEQLYVSKNTGRNKISMKTIPNPLANRTSESCVLH